MTLEPGTRSATPAVVESRATAWAFDLAHAGWLHLLLKRARPTCAGPSNNQVHSPQWPAAASPTRLTPRVSSPPSALRRRFRVATADHPPRPPRWTSRRVSVGPRQARWLRTYHPQHEQSAFGACPIPRDSAWTQARHLGWGRGVIDPGHGGQGSARWTPAAGYSPRDCVAFEEWLVGGRQGTGVAEPSRTRAR